MTLRSLLVLNVLFAGACASAGTPASRSPQPPATVQPPPSQPATGPSAATPAETAERAAAPNWHLLDVSADRVTGISLERAQRELLTGKQPRRTVVVAVIDGGVDTAHADLRANLWTNAKEVAGNGRDDDNNGYVDDVFGWNFIGGADGHSVQWDTYEVTRLKAACQAKSPAVTTVPCDSVEKAFESKKSETERILGRVNQIAPAYERATQILKQALRTDSLTPERLHSLGPASPTVQEARSVYQQLSDAGINAKVIAETRKSLEEQLKYGLNTEFDPRGIVGDDQANLADKRYGNHDVTGPDAMHGTHVAGIIGAVRGNGVGIDGIAPAVRIMAVRAVPDGDERDKDVANAVRYAVDNGAHVINMSFGKSWSPNKGIVDDAMKYADSKGVLLIHAAGNDGEDLAMHSNFPTPALNDGSRIKNWIEVGASSWRGADTLAASFSNYGRAQVDVFAPGEDILSTVPGSGYERESGTSMAAPVVSGLAALIMAYYPDLSAADVRRVILESASRLADRTTLRPGSEDQRVSFGTLSATGGVVNAFSALRMAEQLAAAKR